MKRKYCLPFFHKWFDWGGSLGLGLRATVTITEWARTGYVEAIGRWYKAETLSEYVIEVLPREPAQIPCKPVGMK